MLANNNNNRNKQKFYYIFSSYNQNTLDWRLKQFPTLLEHSEIGTNATVTQQAEEIIGTEMVNNEI